jgi:adenylate cyclase
LKAQPLWHFGFWRLRQMREPRRLGVRDIVPPGHYRDVVVLADLCSFSSFVRDTPNAEVIRENPDLLLFQGALPDHQQRRHA